MVNVSTDLSIISISGLDLEKMELKIDMFLIQVKFAVYVYCLILIYP